MKCWVLICEYICVELPACVCLAQHMLMAADVLRLLRDLILTASSKVSNPLASRITSRGPRVMALSSSRPHRQSRWWYEVSRLYIGQPSYTIMFPEKASALTLVCCDDEVKVQAPATLTGGAEGHGAIVLPPPQAEQVVV